MKVKSPEVTNGVNAGEAKKVKMSDKKMKKKKKSPRATTKKKAEKSAIEKEEEEEVPLTRYEEESEDSDREEDGVENGKGGKKKVRYVFCQEFLPDFENLFLFFLL